MILIKWAPFSYSNANILKIFEEKYYPDFPVCLFEYLATK